jgi:hypothetical protein
VDQWHRTSNPQRRTTRDNANRQRCGIARRRGSLRRHVTAVANRETTAADDPAELFVVRVGARPQNVNVDTPDPV